MNPYTKATDQYLAQKILGATAVQTVVLLLERAERELPQAILALERRDYEAKGRSINRVGAILEELMLMVSQDGGEASADLMRLYTWWMREVFEASETKDAGRLETVARQIAEVRQAWSQSDQKDKTEPQGSSLQGGELIG